MENTAGKRKLHIIGTAKDKLYCNIITVEIN